MNHHSTNHSSHSESLIALQLAHFGTTLQLNDVPETVQQRALHLMVDAIGLAYASAPYDFSRQTLLALQDLSGGQGMASVIGHREKLSVRDAMIMNGLLIHALDFDDTHSRGVIHATASALPCAIGLAEQEKTSGADLLLAYILAMEVSTRVGMAAQGGFHQTGFHPTGMAGTFGCTVAASRMLKLTPRQTASAQGIVMSMASGSLEFLADGAWNKRIHPGWAAASATTAATLARRDFIGTGKPYEGRYGIYHSYLAAGGADAARPDLSLVTAGLGSQWEIEGVAIKPIPACHFTHAASDAAIALHRAHGAATFNASDIASIVVRMPKVTIDVVCEPEQQKQNPANSYEAQFSIPYVVAVGLLHGRFVLDDLEPSALNNPQVRALAQKIGYVDDPDTTFPRHYTGEVVVTLKNGLTLQHREAMNRGCADRPLSNDDIVAKFFDNATRTLTRSQAESVLQSVLSLARQPASALLQALAAPAR